MCDNKLRLPFSDISYHTVLKDYFCLKIQFQQNLTFKPNPASAASEAVS